MKKIILATLGMGLLAMGLNTASAANVGVGATVPPACSMPATPTATSATAGLGVVAGAVVVDPASPAGTAQLTYGSSSCNYAAYIGVQSGNSNSALEVGAGAIPAGMAASFAAEIPYKATVGFCGVTAEIEHGTATTDKQSTLCTAAPVGSVVLDVVSTAPSLPLFATSYDDTITVQLGAAL